MTKTLDFWQVDSFANQPFKGNPAAIFVLREPLDDALMQNIAVEVNLSETAFILLRGSSNPLLRWFTPVEEIDLCGHATLAGAHIYLTEFHPDRKNVTFETKFAGPLPVNKNAYGYTMNFPQRPGKKTRLKDIPPFVLEALGPEEPIESYKSRDLMLVYEDARTVRDMKPDYKALREYPGFILVTSRSDKPEYDFISRFFCADEGIDEDPVTGSAHCTSGPYWSDRLNKKVLKAYQASRRGGALDLELTSERILISGPALTVISGTLTVPDAT